MTAVVSLGRTILADPNKGSGVLLDSLPSHLNVGDEYEGFTLTAMTKSPQQRPASLGFDLPSIFTARHPRHSLGADTAGLSVYSLL